MWWEVEHAREVERGRDRVAGLEREVDKVPPLQRANSVTVLTQPPSAR